MSYRKDIQILRGIAVLLVVLFHLELFGVKSGFLGVDIFFVISGYLMAMLYDENKKIEFFVKRAKRLFPAYYVTIFVTVVASLFLTTPNEFHQVQKQSIFALAFSSNIGYWLQNSYFSKAEFNVLLHLWSLGVEIQFYLSVPIICWILGKNRFYILIILLVSLFCCFYLVKISPKTSFFMTPLRLWQFMIGWACAQLMLIPEFANKSLAHKILGGVALLVVLAIPFMKVDGEALSIISGHPAVYSLMVSMATGLIILLGMPKFFQDTKLGTGLEVVGKYSYSLYLVHFPVIVLFLCDPFMGTKLRASDAFQTLTMIVIILILTALLYHMVEDPMRRSQTIRPRLILAPLAVLLLVLVGPRFQDVVFCQQENLIFKAFRDRDCYRCGKMIRLMEPKAISCETTKNVLKPRFSILLVGNSHADSIKYTFSSVAEQKRVRVRFMVDNDPLLKKNDPEEIVNEAISREMDAIVIHNSPGSVPVERIKQLVDLAREKNILIAFIMPVPCWKVHIPRALWRNLRTGEPLPVQTKNDYESAVSQYSEQLSKIQSDNFFIYNISNVFCAERCAIVNQEGRPLYFDATHLTITGSELLRPVFENIISDLMENRTFVQPETAKGIKDYNSKKI